MGCGRLERVWFLVARKLGLPLFVSSLLSPTLVGMIRSNSIARSRVYSVAFSIHVSLEWCDAVGWVAAAFFVAKWTRFFHIIFLDDRIIRPLLYVAMVCLGINTVLLCYLTVYLPKVKKLTDTSAWDVYCPRVVPAMTLSGIVCGVSLIRSTWPVWGMLAPLILGIEAMGFLFTMHFIPSVV